MSDELFENARWLIGAIARALYAREGEGVSDVLERMAEQDLSAEAFPFRAVADIDIGFARAFTAILDGQLTTAAAGWVLLQYGSGPIQGFATMLLVGIGTTLFTNVWVSRLFFDLWVGRDKNAETLSI